MEIKELLNKVLNRDKRSLAKAISIVENGEGYELLNDIYKYTGKAYRIGITGPPGAGKSTLTNELIKIIFKSGLKAGVIAVDPTSPFTGGALLGDRVRMQDSSMLENVFVRSMATRGSLGGLSKSVNEVCDLLDAAGYDFILIETVGVGQSELDIAETADTTLVVLVPESGDSVQAMKAGLMEIADVFVLNKSDRAGADLIASTIENVLQLKHHKKGERGVKVLKTVAARGTGIRELYDEIHSHKHFLESTNTLMKRRKEHIIKKIHELVSLKLKFSFWDEKKTANLNRQIEKIMDKSISPYEFAEMLTREL